MARQGGHPGVLVKFAMTAVCCESILVKCESEVTGIKAGLDVECGVPAPEPEPEA
jgi:hypothetical protein